MLIDNYNEVLMLCENVNVVVVSKNQCEKDLETLINYGVKVFGENRVDDLVQRQIKYPSVEFHMIGRLQTNKVRKLLAVCNLIHSVDSIHLLDYINKEAARINKVQNILLQVNISGEESKAGFDVDQIDAAVTYANRLDNIKVLGLMMMAPNTDDEKYLETLFKSMYEVYQRFNLLYLSMGMSNDFELAINCGSNMVRVGSKIFNEKKRV